MQYVAASGASYVAQRRTLGSSDAAARLDDAQLSRLKSVSPRRRSKLCFYTIDHKTAWTRSHEGGPRPPCLGVRRVCAFVFHSSSRSGAGGKTSESSSFVRH